MRCGSGSEVAPASCATGNSNNIGWFNTYYATGGDAPLADCSQSHPLPIETGKWLCMEWQWDRKTHQWASWIDGEPQQLLMYKASDGRGIALGGSVREKKCWIIPKIDTVRLGWMQTREPLGALSMWIDDAALSTQRIGCGAPSAETK